jgi:hypothetical protein
MITVAFETIFSDKVKEEELPTLTHALAHTLPRFP